MREENDETSRSSDNIQTLRYIYDKRRFWDQVQFNPYRVCNFAPLIPLSTRRPPFSSSSLIKSSRKLRM